jgi:hypothetical protein
MTNAAGITLSRGLRYATGAGIVVVEVQITSAWKTATSKETHE